MNNKTKRNTNKEILGGKVLASGGFGCVFSPALKCVGEKRKAKNQITKLMKEKYAKEEYEEITSIKIKLQDIPNYENYFLIHSLKLCKPQKLSKEDLVNYTKKCSALKKDGITKNNINDSLDKLMALNMPNGGLPVDDYIYENGSFENIHELNHKLINLLKNGIVPMNKKHIYHCDIKDSNVLVDNSISGLKNIKTRLIDWGLSTQYIPFKNEPFPKTWRNRPLQFNVPFSVIIFTDDFVQKYTEYIENGGQTDETNLKPFVFDYLHFWIKKRGPGHYKFINEIMFILFNKELNTITKEDIYKVIENTFTIPYIVNYIVDVLVHYTRFREDGSLDIRVYLDNVFIEIVDVWGFITIYFPLLEVLYNNYDELTPNQMQMFQLLKNIFIDYLYSPRVKPIILDDLYTDLNKLNTLINLEINAENNKSNKFSEFSESIKNSNSINSNPINSKNKLKISTLKEKGITGHTFIPKSVKENNIIKTMKNKKNTKISFNRIKKSKNKKTKKLFLLSSKIKK